MTAFEVRLGLEVVERDFAWISSVWNIYPLPSQHATRCTSSSTIRTAATWSLKKAPSGCPKKGPCQCPISCVAGVVGRNSNDPNDQVGLPRSSPLMKSSQADLFHSWIHLVGVHRVMNSAGQLWSLSKSRGSYLKDCSTEVFFKVKILTKFLSSCTASLLFAQAGSSHVSLPSATSSWYLPLF